MGKRSGMIQYPDPFMLFAVWLEWHVGVTFRSCCFGTSMRETLHHSNDIFSTNNKCVHKICSATMLQHHRTSYRIDRITSHPSMTQATPVAQNFKTHTHSHETFTRYSHIEAFDPVLAPHYLQIFIFYFVTAPSVLKQ